MPIYEGNCHCGVSVLNCMCNDVFTLEQLAEIKRMEDEEDDRLIKFLRCPGCGKVEDCRCES
jgi:hypothetical protein